MKTLGLLGGMSWESSSLYYITINQLVRDALGQNHSCACIMHSFDFAEIATLQAQGAWDQLTDKLSLAAQNLVNAGAQAVVILTNTMHLMADEVQRRAGVPLLHIVDFTGERIERAGLRKAGLVATRYTMELPFYRERLMSNFGVELLVPDPTGRDAVHRIIYEELCRGMVTAESRRVYVDIIEGLVARGAECIILGCTEITMLIKDEDVSVPVFDTTRIHCEGIVEWALREDKACGNATE